MLRSSVQILCGGTDISEAHAQVQFISTRQCSWALHHTSGLYLNHRMPDRVSATLLTERSSQVQPLEIEGGSVPKEPRIHKDSVCEGRPMATERSGRCRELERQLEAERRQHALEPPGHKFTSAQDKMPVSAHRVSYVEHVSVWAGSSHALVQELDAVVGASTANGTHQKILYHCELFCCRLQGPLYSYVASACRHGSPQSKCSLRAKPVLAGDVFRAFVRKSSFEPLSVN